MCHAKTKLLLWSWNGVWLGCILELKIMEESLQASEGIELHSGCGILVTRHQLGELSEVGGNKLKHCLISIFQYLDGCWFLEDLSTCGDMNIHMLFLTSSHPRNKINDLVDQMKNIFPSCSSPSLFKNHVLFMTHSSLDQYYLIVRNYGYSNYKTWILLAWHSQHVLPAELSCVSHMKS